MFLLGYLAEKHALLVLKRNFVTRCVMERIFTDKSARMCTIRPKRRLKVRFYAPMD